MFFWFFQTKNVIFKLKIVFQQPKKIFTFKSNSTIFISLFLIFLKKRKKFDEKENKEKSKVEFDLNVNILFGC